MHPSIRLSKTFWETYNFLQKSQWWSREKLEEYQIEQLSKLLHHAYTNVPYYRRVFDEKGLKPKDIQDFGDLRKLPYVTKEIVRDNLPDLVARNYPQSKLQYVTTGGSTGIPLGFYREKGISGAKEWAFMLTQWNRVGFKIGDRCVVLRGNVVRSANSGKFWEYHPISKNLVVSSYHLSDETLPKYVDKIREFKPDYIQAYPSAITILARFMRANNIAPFPSVKALLCGSENLYPWQRELLEEVFQCRVFSWYGLSEMAALAGECEKSTYYHVFPEYGILELIGNDGSPVIDEDNMGEIVATGLNNFACPLIRYRTGDLALPEYSSCECGRNYPLLKRVEGRLQEFVVANDGSFITLGPAIFSIHHAEWTKIKQIQFLQETPGELIVQVVKAASYSEAEIKDYVLGLFKARFEGRCELEVRFVDHIPRTQSGKYRFLNQKLPIEFGD
ncbi:phenylacetate--CoA ligase family protein [bacterium]|nr:phenylacetate--CoA ligase family protein [bacterium]